MRSMPGQELTIGSLRTSLFGRSATNRILLWPPDVFCFTAMLLKSSGAYTLASTDSTRNRQYNLGRSREKKIKRIAKSWRRAVNNDANAPQQVLEWWAAISRARSILITDLLSNVELVYACINLLAAADETCRGIGVNVADDRFSERATDRLFYSTNTGSRGSTLCLDVPASKARVLPKMHTSQSGLTIRSFSHHLAFVEGNEIEPNWHMSAALLSGADIEKRSYNLLLIPTPRRVAPKQFLSSDVVRLTDDVRRGSYGLFTFEITEEPSPDELRNLISSAEALVGDVSGVVLPESALTVEGYEALRTTVLGKDRFLLAGIGKPAQGRKAGSNYLVFEQPLPGNEYTIRIEQRKHHRWKLTKSQVIQYGIGANLLPPANWWEHIELTDRQVHFVNLLPWLTLCPLICEDLARPDPVGDMIRAVGPNLVLALLMDGPQISARWPGRYAAALSDDPGASVLSFTSKGVAALSKRSGSNDRSRTVALWRDAGAAEAMELEIPDTARAAVLTIAVEYKEEWTADGRGDERSSGYPMFAGFHLIA